MAIPCQRSFFNIPQDITYYNCAYLSPLMAPVKEAGQMGVMRKATPWEMKPAHFFDESNQLRRLFAEMIGGQEEGVAIAPAVSYAIGIAAKNIKVQAHQNIVVLAEQFPSNIYAWQDLAQGSGASIRTVARPKDSNWTSAVLDALDENTGVAALPNCHWTDGSMVDLVAVGQKCRSLNIPLVLDVTQSLGAMPLDVKEIKPAFLVAAGYKWLMGPYSMAYLYVDEAYRNGEPLEYNWITRNRSENFAGLVDYTHELSPGAQRFDVGERSNFHLMPMAVASLKQLLAWGIPKISETLKAYNTTLIQRAEALGFKPIPEAHRSPHLLGLRFPGLLPAELSARLAENNIFVSIRGDAIRISPHVYNNQADLDRFIHVLEKEIGS